jgi:arsenate reductase
MTTIWHNPRCSKSRQTLALLEEKGLTPKIRKYLEDAPSATEIKDVLKKLGKSPLELVRTNEAEFKELGLKGASDDALIAAMASHPKLIERPVVIEGESAAIGRPPESVLALF